ncbi:MAG: hypothetical protein P4M09_12660 [Devosia sp.]|nr:hypothetical protein [Devosia sp.]
MHAITPRSAHLWHPGSALRRLVAWLLDEIVASWSHLVSRNAARAGGDADILWEDGEPEEDTDIR